MRSFKKAIPPVLILVFSFLLGAEGVKGQYRGDQAVINAAERITRDTFTVSTETPQGARIYAVRAPNARMLEAIDQGLDDLFDAADRNGYRRRLNHSDYVIFIARADRQFNRDRQYSPDIAVPTGQYAGSVYDQGGFIYAAGMVIGYNPLAFVIAEHDRDYPRVSEAVRNEGEHLVLYHNDRRRYNATLDHSRGGGHPILP
ncbi:MAG TPA: hypothetical protein VK400_16650 [Pyrinomonadaceae bacterium]|nr:hypothetical protein [Pyrinomonadaceae bacterium]